MCHNCNLLMHRKSEKSKNLSATAIKFDQYCQSRNNELKLELARLISWFSTQTAKSSQNKTIFVKMFHRLPEKSA